MSLKELVHSYAQLFVTDHFQYLKVVNDADEWVDSFSSDMEAVDVMTCFRVKDIKQLVCDFRFQYIG